MAELKADKFTKAELVRKLTPSQLGDEIFNRESTIEYLKFQLENLSEKPLNKIQIADFLIESNTEPLKVVEATMNKLIKQHKNFSQYRLEQIKLKHLGIYG